MLFCSYVNVDFVNLFSARGARDSTVGLGLWSLMHGGSLVYVEFYSYMELWQKGHELNLWIASLFKRGLFYSANVTQLNLHD
jgi:hypothetical protein